MTTHVFIVDENTFRYHLEYMFAGTGSKDYVIDFNNTQTSNLHHSTEASLVGLMADGCRVRKNDLIIFYLQASYQHEGTFFGIFQAIDDGIFLDNFDTHQFLGDKLRKSLTFRLLIKPYEVYSKGVSEWSALDEIKGLTSPNQMLWSLIYRKLKGNRGNTMITIYESERLIDLIRKKNCIKSFPSNVKYFSYDCNSNTIVSINNHNQYIGRQEPINILPRLIVKYNTHKAFESHLQMYITQNLGLGTNKSLDESLGILNNKIEWLGNEVSCGVGMQRIDVMFSIEETSNKRFLYPIELKAVGAHKDNTRQLTRYIDWIEQYYIPNRISIIQPVLICKKEYSISDELKNSFKNFNKRAGIIPLKYIEFEIIGTNIVFNKVEY
mgnify:CR=1 FL=1